MLNSMLNIIVTFKVSYYFTIMPKYLTLYINNIKTQNIQHFPVKFLALMKNLLNPIYHHLFIFLLECVICHIIFLLFVHSSFLLLYPSFMKMFSPQILLYPQTSSFLLASTYLFLILISPEIFSAIYFLPTSLILQHVAFLYPMIHGKMPYSTFKDFLLYLFSGPTLYMG